MTQIKNVILDFDGTIADTAPLIIHTMQETMRHMDLPLKTEEECRAVIGLRLEEIGDALWPDKPGISQEYARCYRDIFDKLKRPLKVNCFPNVTGTLRVLHDTCIGMAIASSRSHASLEEYLEQLGLRGYFNKIVGGDDVIHGKPAPDPILTITETLDWRPEETLTVGDAAVDIRMGNAAGTLTCAVTYGNGTYTELLSAGPDYIVSEFQALTEIIADAGSHR